MFTLHEQILYESSCSEVIPQPVHLKSPLESFRGNIKSSLRNLEQAEDEESP